MSQRRYFSTSQGNRPVSSLIGRGSSIDIVLDSHRLRAFYVATLFRAVAELLIQGIKAGAEGLSGWQNRRRARAALLALDDRLLRDIGLSRADVDTAVRLSGGQRSANENTGAPANHHEPRSVA
jgi:uncharacterized protein YjiS (DUF1127 family)